VEQKTFSADTHWI